MAYAGAAKVESVIPNPSTKRPTANAAKDLLATTMTIPRMTIQHPQNMVHRRPYLSLMTAPIGEPTMCPLMCKTVFSVATVTTTTTGQGSIGSFPSVTYTVYRHAINDTLGPDVPV
jgi:hypothetical protein